MKKFAKWSQTFLYTKREAPNDAEIPSHQLLMRGGYLKKISPGIYTYGVLALRAIRKFENIIREEHDEQNCNEVLMPMVLSADLWKESGRWDVWGKDLLKLKNRNDHEYCLGATHEEVITDFVRNSLVSYKDFPRYIYQIQNKYRDEIRPRFGLMRGREFIMKDAYSFDLSIDDAFKSYDVFFTIYSKIFDRIGLNYRIVNADAGSMGGNKTQEFQVLANSGEDQLMVCSACNYASNIEVTPKIVSNSADGQKNSSQEIPGNKSDIKKKEKFATPGLKTIAALSEKLDLPESQLVKTLFLDISQVEGEYEPVTILLRGSDELNIIKLKSFLKLTLEPRMLTDKEVFSLTGAYPGSCGPVGLSGDIYADANLQLFTNFIVGANEDGFHLRNVNFKEDFNIKEFGDIVSASEGDLCHECNSALTVVRGIEVGHIFYLGTKYSESMKAKYLDSNGKQQSMHMGCYGIGVGRTVQAAVEQSHDENGIIWPRSISPFDIHVCLLDPKDEAVLNVLSGFGDQFQNSGFDYFVDDRKERPGVKFKDADLLGFPVRVNLGKKGLDNNTVEVVCRKTGEKYSMEPKEVILKVTELLEKA